MSTFAPLGGGPLLTDQEVGGWCYRSGPLLPIRFKWLKPWGPRADSNRSCLLAVKITKQESPRPLESSKRLILLRASGADERTRTADLLITNPSELSVCVRTRSLVYGISRSCGRAVPPRPAASGGVGVQFGVRSRRGIPAQAPWGTPLRPS